MCLPVGFSDTPALSLLDYCSPLSSVPPSIPLRPLSRCRLIHYPSLLSASLVLSPSSSTCAPDPLVLSSHSRKLAGMEGGGREGARRCGSSTLRFVVEVDVAGSVEASWSDRREHLSCDLGRHFKELSLAGVQDSTNDEASKGGAFNVDLCDVIMRLWTYLDKRMYDYYVKYGEVHKPWRHFLPATFADCVITQQDYLQSDKVRASFIGDHIRYRVENCQMFILPVQYLGKWSCYFWDMKLKTMTIMDPTSMKSEPIKASLHHQHIVIAIHKAFIDCINHFFIGWSVDYTGWDFRFPTNHGPRCKAVNSGLYAVHYARAFDGESIHFDVMDPTDSNLSEARSEILYWLFSMAGNFGYFPEDLFAELGIYI